MNLQRHRFQVTPVRLANLLPVRHLSFAGHHRDLGRLGLAVSLAPEAWHLAKRS